MSNAEHLTRLAEDELTRYSTDARKIERLRPKFGLAVPYPQQQDVRAEILASVPDNVFAQLIANNRQLVALPFWGIGGLGLLLGISLRQPLDFLATAFGFAVAFQVQRLGWQLEAKRLAIATLDAIETDVAARRQSQP